MKNGLKENKLPVIELIKKNPDTEQEKKLRNMFVLRKGNSKKDSKTLRQNSNGNEYGIDIQGSINSINKNESCYSRENSIERKQLIKNSLQSSSNGFTKSPFNAYSQSSSFKTPRQGIGAKMYSVNSDDNFEISNMNSLQN